MFVLTSDITIGPFVKVKPHDVKIIRSLNAYVDKATIRVPASARMKMQGESVSESTETANEIVEGMPVVIKLGYNGDLKTEFVGFVARVNLNTPCEIECEGYSYQLRKKIITASFKNTTVKNIITQLVSNTDIKISSLIPEIKVAKLVFNGMSGTEAMEQLLKEIKGLSIYFNGKELYAGLRYLSPKSNVKYRIGWNVIKDNNLKLREAKNQQVIIKIKGQKPDGTKVEAEFGDKGEVKQLSTHAVTDSATLKQMAEAEHRSISYTGYEGKITAFLEPYCEPGYSATIIDAKYPQREGKYMINSVEVVYGMSGARRTVDIGFKLDG